jgi:hypothetical protein
MSRTVEFLRKDPKNDSRPPTSLENRESSYRIYYCDDSELRAPEAVSSEVVAPGIACVAEVLLSINAIHLALVAANRPLYDGSYFLRCRFLNLCA